MEWFAKIKEFDKKIFRTEVMLWEKKARFRGEQEIFYGRLSTERLKMEAMEILI
jgi:hypothetical protein